MMRKNISHSIFFWVFSALVLANFKVYGQNPDSLFIKANQQYEAENFESAAALYEQISDSGYVAAELFFNLGNTYFKLNRTALAILNYERALLLSPQNDDVKFNLEMVRTFTIDRIEPLPEFILLTWYRNFRNLFTPTVWVYLSVSFFGFALFLLTLFWFSNGRVIKRLSFSFALLFLFLSVSTVVFAAQENVQFTSRSEAIVMNPVVAVKSSPGETGKDIFILHSGTKVKITKSIGQWEEIKIADGNKGWIRKIDIERI
jgi:tetratricopeptide (TPR) repeat protein